MLSDIATTRQPRREWWLLALPASYLAHVGEEWCVGEGFASWTQRVVAVPVSETRFAVVNAIAAPLFLLGTLLAIIRPSWTWFTVMFGTIVLINCALHVLGSAFTASYSPGVVTGLALYLPLGLAVMRRGHSRSSGVPFWAAVLLGVAIHAIVAVVAFWG